MTLFEQVARMGGTWYRGNWCFHVFWDGTLRRCKRYLLNTICEEWEIVK